MRFWDSSALVPLVVQQPGSAEVEAWLAADPELVTWTLCGVEIVSALRRLARDGVLRESVVAGAEDLASELLRRSHVVVDVERVKALATRLLRVHALRAGDALQLGAALAWADGAPAELVLHTFDQRLALAARREGFRVFPDGKG